MEKKTTNLNEMFTELEQITQQMEAEISLEESFTLYSQGLELLKKCSAKIDKIEKKIQVLDDKGDTHEL